MTDDSVTVYYKTPARFLGIFPASINANVSVSSDEQVKVRFPWYRFLFKVRSEVDSEEFRDEIKAEAAGSVKQIMQTQVKAGSSGDAAMSTSEQLEFSAKARLLQVISDSLKVRYDAEVSAEGIVN